jgi:hypothetical protein
MSNIAKNYSGTVGSNTLSVGIDFISDLGILAELPPTISPPTVVSSAVADISPNHYNPGAPVFEAVKWLNVGYHNSDLMLINDNGLLRIIPAIRVYPNLINHVVNGEGFTIGQVVPKNKVRQTLTQSLPYDFDLATHPVGNSALISFSEIDVANIEVLNLETIAYNVRVKPTNVISYYHVLHIPLLSAKNQLVHYLHSVGTGGEIYQFSGIETVSDLYIPLPL